MDLPEILDIILQYLKVLAWPFVVFALALVYRKPVITLLHRLKKYSGLGQIIELGDQARELKEDSEEALITELPALPSTPSAGPSTKTEPQPPQPPTSEVNVDRTRRDDPGKHVTPSRIRSRLDSFRSIASIDPVDFPTGSRRAISKAWRSVNKTADTLATRLNLAPSEINLQGLAVALVNRGLITKGTALISFRLAELYSSLMESTDRDLNIDVIINFVDTAANLQELLEKALETLNDPQPEAGGNDH